MVKRFPVSNVSFEDVVDWSNDFPFRTFPSQTFFDWLKKKKKKKSSIQIMGLVKRKTRF